MIRQATSADVGELIRLGVMMHAESPRFRHLPFRPDKLEALSGPLLERGIALLAEDYGEVVGMALGFVVPHFFTDAMVATDLAIYVVPAYRGGPWFLRLMRHFEQTAVELGADELSIGVNTEVDPERTARLFERLGYQRSGIGMLKYVRPETTAAAVAG